MTAYVWFEIGDNYYEFDVSGDLDEVYLPKFVSVLRDGDSARMECLTWDTFEREWTIEQGLQEREGRRALEDACHARLIEAISDDYDDSRKDRHYDY